MPGYEFELLAGAISSEKRFAFQQFRSKTIAVLCKLKITWFLLALSHTFQNFRASLKLTLKLFIRATRCYFPIVTTCFDFLISLETVDLEADYIKTLCEVRGFVINFKLQNAFFYEPRFSHLGNITDFKCK